MRTSAPTLQSALRQPAGTRFLDAVMRLAVPPAARFTPLAKRPELVRLVVVLQTLYATVTAEGMWKFLSTSDAHRDIPAAQRWCQRIGAERVVQYLAAAVALFPKKKLPDSVRRRDAWIARLERRTPDPLGVLDREHQGAVDEMVECLRAYMRDNVTNFERAFAAPIPAGPPVVLVYEAALARADAVVANVLKQGKVLARKAEARRQALGIAAVFATGPDPRLLRFVDEISALTPAQWRTVIERRAARRVLMQRALEEASAVALDVHFPDRVYPRAEAERRRANGKQARERTAGILASLPEGELRNQVRQAILQTLHAFYALDELMVSKKGERSVKQLVAAFDGYVTLPWEARAHPDYLQSNE